MKNLIFVALCCGVVQVSAGTVQLNQEVLKPESRIINGVRPNEKQFPWYVLIRTTLPDGSTLRCGGSVLSNNWVLTSAQSTENVVVFYLRFGSISSTGSVLFEAYAYSAIVHPEYTPRTMQNDVALIRLQSPIPFVETIQPIRLPSLSQSSTSFAGVVATISGFGYISDTNHSMPLTLLTANVSVIENSACQSIYGATVVTPQVMCTRGTESASNSFCKGDEGGALVFQPPNGTPTLIGVMSFTSDRGCSSGDPAGYSRMTKFVNWITSITGIPTIP